MRSRLCAVLLLILVSLAGQAWAVVGEIELTRATVTNLRTALTKAGASVALSDGTTYLAQNRSGGVMYFANEATAPASSSDATFTIAPGSFFAFKVISGSDPYVWALGPGTGPFRLIVGTLP